MKKGAIITLLILLIGLAWFNIVTGASKLAAQEKNARAKAKESYDACLYEQSIEQLKEVLKFSKDESVYKDILKVCESWYEEEHTAKVRNVYLSALEAASDLYPRESYYVRQVELYEEAGKYDKAYEIASNAIVYKKITGEDIVRLYNELHFMEKLDFNAYYDFKYAGNGYITLFDGTNWFVASEKGEALTGKYKYISIMNGSGYGLYVKNNEANILDKSHITRYRLNKEVLEAGCYNYGVGIIPVRTEDGWHYLGNDGQFIGGTYDFAGCFAGEKSVAKRGDKFYLVDNKGNESALDFEDVKYELHDSHAMTDIVIAKKNGKYDIYNLDFTEKVQLGVEDIDIYNDGYIAYKKGDKWGFIDKDGNEVIEPQYAAARSFSAGYAAVCDEEGKWGFINQKGKLVIDYKYLDAWYFTPSHTCLVSAEEGKYKIMSFRFDK